MLFAQGEEPSMSDLSNVDPDDITVAHDKDDDVVQDADPDSVAQADQDEREADPDYLAEP
jgi:hypothetical protein